MIEDGELRSLFQAESEEHLQRLDEALLRLERTPTDAPTLDEAFREAHSLKGAAGMLNVAPVARAAHGLEDTLGRARRGDLALGPAVIDDLCRTVDRIRGLVREAINGAESAASAPGPSSESPPAAAIPPVPAAAPAEVRRSQAADVARGPAPEAAPAPYLNGAGAGSPLFAHPEPVVAAAVEGLAAPYRITTVRVETQRLDDLLRQAGELTVTRTYLTRRLAEITELAAFCESLPRELAARGAARRREVPESARSGDAPLALLLDRLEEVVARLRRLQEAAQEDHARLEYVAQEMEEGIRAARLVPLSTLFNLYPRAVRDLAREQGKEVELVIEGGETAADKRIVEEMKDPLMHVVRNAVDHGIESPEERLRSGKPLRSVLRLRAWRTASNVVIEVRDDGRGLDLSAIRETALRRRLFREEELAAMTPAQIQDLVFAPGFSTRNLVTDVSGRGVGLDVVRANVERLKGTLRIESRPGHGCAVQVRLPLTLATMRALIAAVQGHPYALAVEHVETAVLLKPGDLFRMEGRDTMLFNGQPVSVLSLAELLELRAPQRPKGPAGEKLRPCILLSQGGERLAVTVDALVDEQEVVLKPLGPLLRRVRNVSGATILGTGEVCMVLNPSDLFKTVRKRTPTHPQQRQATEAEHKRVVLLADDSITTRVQEKRILEGAGYDVVTAVDGLDALGKLATRTFDAVVSDVEMPNMDGLSLTAAIRRDQHYSELPVILVTSLASDEDRKRGIDVGASAYLPKSSFDQRVLLDVLGRLT